MNGLVLTIAIATLFPGAAIAVTIGQIDTFESGTVEGWVAGGGPVGQTPPVPPQVVGTGGPAGLGDSYLSITAIGGGGPGSRLTAFNIMGQWAGNYLTASLPGIGMDLINLGQTELSIRLEFENPFAGSDFALTNTAIVLPVGSGWTRAFFPIALGQFTALGGTVEGALANTSVLRILHAPGVGQAVPVVGVLGVDNITAAVPEPSTFLLAAAGLALLIRRRVP